MSQTQTVRKFGKTLCNNQYIQGIKVEVKHFTYKNQYH
jgi:hypothetical protein